MYIFQIMKKMSVLGKDNPKITPNKIILFIKGKKLSKSTCEKVIALKPNN